MDMAMKGQKLKFDEFSLVILGGIIFLGILVIGFSTPGEFPVRVTPTEVSLDLDPGSSASFDFNVSRKVSGVNASTSGSIASWITLSRYDIGATGDSIATVTATVNVPESARSGVHTGKIVVLSREGRAEIDVRVSVSAVKQLTSRTFSMGDFRVSYSSGAETIGTHEGTFVSKSYLFEKPLQIVGLVDEEKLPILVRGTVRFVVEDTNNYGPIIVTQNGQQIFSELVGPGEVVVPMNMSNMRRSNTIRIESGAPGFFFWAENLYNIRDVSVDISYEGPVSKTFSFGLTPQEFGKFDSVQITYVAGTASPALPPMRIDLNGQTAFFEVPPRTVFNRKVSRDIFGAPFSVGERNNVTFSFGDEASYEVTDARLTVFSRAR